MTDRWLLLVGAALCFGALLMAMLWLTSWRIPRAQGLPPPRGVRLTGVARRAESITDNVLERGGQKSIIGDALERAGLDLRPGEFMVVVTLTALVLGVGGWLLVAPLFGLVVAALVVALSKVVVVNVLAGRRRRRFGDQLSDTLQLLVGSLRAGNGLTQSLDTVAREAESPTSTEFRRLVVETRLGRDLSDALQALASRMRSPDMEWVVQAIDINREVGGDLTVILDTITSTIRDRGRLRRQVSALTAEGRLSAIVVMSMPFALGGFMAVSNPSYIGVLFTSGTGLVLLATGAVLLAVGGLWLRKLVTPVF